MRNKYLSIVAVMLFFLAVISFAFRNGETNFILDEFYGPFLEEPDQDDDTKDYSIRVKIGNTIEILPLEEYIIGVVAGEMPASFSIEALKAQAVASRSYALYKKSQNSSEYDLTNDVNSQVYIGIDTMKSEWGDNFQKYYDKVSNAVEQTKGKVITFDGEIIQAFYFAMSAGSTNESSQVFGQSKDYLQSVVSEYDNNSLRGYSSDIEFSLVDFKTKLNLTCEKITIGNIIRNDSGYVDTIDICSNTFKGTTFRSKLGIRSTNFDIEVGTNIKITTRGYGHGVGMSQYGANGYANAGYTYEDIIKHYYTGVDIVDLKDV